MDHVVEDCCASVYMRLWSLPVFVACNCVVSKKMLTMLCSRLKGDDTNNNEKGVLTQKKKLGNQSGGGDQLGNQSLGTRVGEPQRRRSWGTSIKEPELGTGI